ncbi:hypothetical protein EV196_106253 [Mariniflexile fucanivorans]|uniref:SpoIIAA-like protein n=1 Tax=Mariniflexile fucanivorans TaxID=264023 RepID=A0A4R1RGG3_9FLAO|nr:hypothetical protein [Mariniflexile fucanivorans]TCL65061.1 hypothetical protein EV196_106253 [Mariniflexile fucanivorans]
MKFENSEFFKLKHNKLEMPFGNFYFFKTFIISEINEGIHFDWEMIQEVMVHVVEFYGTDAKLGYISNRVNSYSTNPQAWNKVQKKYNIIIAGAIVTYNKMIYLNATLEKRIAKTKIKRCFTLAEAIDCILDLKESKNE